MLGETGHHDEALMRHIFGKTENQAFSLLREQSFEMARLRRIEYSRDYSLRDSPVTRDEKPLSILVRDDSGLTGRLSRTAKGLHDIKRLNQIFAGRYPEFDSEKAERWVRIMAFDQV